MFVSGRRDRFRFRDPKYSARLSDFSGVTSDVNDGVRHVSLSLLSISLSFSLSLSQSLSPFLSLYICINIFVFGIYKCVSVYYILYIIHI